MAEGPVLVGTAGALRGKTFRIPERGQLDIGRADGNDVVIEDDDVSRYHVRLIYDNGTLWIQDAGSRNGVFVNDQRLTQHRALKVGDTVRLAEHEFVVRHDDDAPTDETAEEDDRDDTSKKRWFWPFSS